MNGLRALEILHSIAKTWLDLAIIDDAPLRNQINDARWAQKLSLAIREELGLEITATEIESADSLVGLSNLLESRLPKDPNGRSLVDIYAAVKRFVGEELTHDFNYGWYATWTGDLLNNRDSLDDVEILLRMEEAFGFSISDRDVREIHTVGQTVRYLWRRSCEQSFTLRERPPNVCQSVFIFHELRRLLMMRSGVQRTAVRLETRLGDLLPSWYLRFWKQVQDIFRVALPRGNLLSFSLGLEKRTTVRELVALIVSSKR